MILSLRELDIVRIAAVMVTTPPLRTPSWRCAVHRELARSPAPCEPSVDTDSWLISRLEGWWMRRISSRSELPLLPEARRGLVVERSSTCLGSFEHIQRADLLPEGDQMQCLAVSLR